LHHRRNSSHPASVTGAYTHPASSCTLPHCQLLHAVFHFSIGGELQRRSMVRSGMGSSSNQTNKVLSQWTLTCPLASKTSHKWFFTLPRLRPFTTPAIDARTLLSFWRLTSWRDTQIILVQNQTNPSARPKTADRQMRPSNTRP